MAAVADVPTPRSGSSAVMWTAGAEGPLMVVFGGRLDKKTFSDDTYTYHLAGKMWQKLSTTGQCPPPRTGHTANVFNNSMLIFGGYCPYDRTPSAKL